MIKSMTGFSRVMVDSELGPLVLELKSVNSRHLDLNFKMHEALRGYELDFRQLISERLSRGKLEVSFRWSRPSADKFKINETLLDTLTGECARLSEKHALALTSMGATAP